MLVFGVLVFAVMTFIVSFLIGRSVGGDMGKTATVVTITAWTSLAVGLYLVRLTR